MHLQVPRSELKRGARAKSECGKDHVGLNTITFWAEEMACNGHVLPWKDAEGPFEDRNRVQNPVRQTSTPIDITTGVICGGHCLRRLSKNCVAKDKLLRGRLIQNESEYG